MAGVSSYVKNVAKSFGYAIGDTFNDLNPVVTTLVKETKSVTSDLYQSIKSVSFQKDSIDERSFKSQARDIVNATWNNFKDDIKSGNWYNKERSEAASMEMAKALGMDFDFDFDNNWDFDDDSDSAQLAMDSDNTKEIIGAVDSVGAGIANTVATATVESAGYIVASNNKASKALYSLNERGFANVTKGIISLNNTFSSFAQIMEPLQQYMQNSLVFYTKTTETLNSMNQSIQQLVKNTTPAPLANSSKSYSTKRNKFTDIFSSDTGLSIEAYKDMIKENFGEYKDLTDLAVNALKGLTGGGKNISVMQFATTMFTQAMIPKMFKESMKNFNEELKYFASGGITKLRNRNGGFIFSLLKDFLLPQDSFRSQINPDKYNRNAVSWDGVSRKALTEVIPDALMMIYEALTGDNKRYDYSKGKFVTVSSIKKEFDTTRFGYIKTAGGDFREDALKKVESDKKLTDAQRAQLNKEIENYFYQAFMTNDGYNVNSKKFDKSKYGVSDEAVAILRQIIEEDRKTGKKRHQKFTYENISQRELYGDYIRGQESSGDNAILHTLNGSEAKRARLGGNTVDKWGNDSLFYLRGIYSFSGFIADNLKFLAGKSDTIDYTGINKRRTFKNKASSMYSDNVIYTGNGVGEKTKEEASKTTANESASIDAFEDEDEKRRKEREENIKKAKGQAKTTIGNVKDWFRKLVGGGGEKGTIQKWYEQPFNSVALLLDKIGNGLDKLMWGDDENPEKGLFGYLFEKAKKTFGNLFDKLDEKFGLRDAWDKFKSGDFAKETGDNLRSVGSSIGNTVKKFFKSDKKQKVPTAAYGRKVTKSGIVAVSEGELIIPSELNPYYHGATNKASQIRNESNIVNRFYGSFANGGTVGEDDESGPGYRFIKSGFDELGKGIKSFTDRVFGGKEATKEENKQVNEKVKKILEEAGINKGAIGAGAIIGGGVSILTGAMISPILGVAAGAAIGLASKSEYVQGLLFGNEKDPGLLPKKMLDFMKESLPSMGKGAAIGGAVGLFAGSPILGAILGSTVGYISSSEKAKNYIFGELDEEGNRKGGLIPKELQDLIKKKAPNISAGMLAGLALGPFGIAGNLIAGAGLGFITTSDKFHDWMFNEKDGLATKIHDKIIVNIDNLFHNITNNLLGLGKRIVGSAERGIKNFISNRKRGFEEGKGGILNTLIGGTVSLGGGAIKKTVDAAGGILGFANKRVQSRNLARGYAVYDNKAKRNLTAEERLKLRGDYATGTAANMDKVIAGASTIDELNLLQNDLNMLKDPDGYFKRTRNDAITKAYTGLEGAGIDRKQIRNIGKLISSGKFDKARQTAELISDPRQRKQALDTITIAEEKFGEASNKKNTVTDKLKYLQNQGIDLKNPNDIQAFLDRIEDEKKNEKFDKENQEKEINSNYRNTLIDILANIDANLAASSLTPEGAKPAEIPNWLSTKNALRINKVANKARNLLDVFSNKESSEDGDTRHQLTDQGPIKMEKNSQGEWVPALDDSETAETLDKQEEQRNNFATIAKNTGFLAGIGGLFGKLHDKLFGEKNGEKKGFFGKLIDSITGDNGLLGSALQFFGGEKGGVKSLLSKISFKSVLSTAFSSAIIYLIASGKLDDFFHKITNGAYGKGGDSNIYEYKNQDGTTGTATKTEDGSLVDKDGNVIDEEYVTSVREGDSLSLKERFGKNTIRGLLTGDKGTFSSLVTSTKLGKLVKKGVTKLGESSIGKAVKGFGKKAANAVTSAAKKGMKETAEKATDILLKSNLGEGIVKFCKKLKSIPILKNIDVDGLATKLTKSAAEGAASTAGSKALKLASNLVVWAKIAFVVVDFTTGYEDASTIMKVKDPSIGQKVISGLIKAVNGFIPVIGSLIPESLLVDIFVEFVAPLLGMDVEEFNKQRDEAEDELAKYNAENGTDLSWQEYNKQVLKNYTWTEHIGNAGKSVWQGTKNTFKKIGSWFGGGGSGAGNSGTTHAHISQYDSRYKDMKLGSSTVAEKGCGPAVAAMIANSYGTNLSMEDAIRKAQGYQDNGGTKSMYFADALGSAGIDTKYLSGANIPNQVLSRIAKGEQVILMGRNEGNVSKDISPFGPHNHYVIASGIDKNGNIIIRDPESSHVRAYNPSILNSASMGIGTSKSAGAFSNYDTDIARKTYGYFTSMGYSPVVASAIMGNLFGESGMNPASIQGGGKGPAAGIAQWENYNTKSGRWANLNEFANSMGYAWSDLDPQLQFIHKELQGLDAFFKGSGKAMSNLTKVGAEPTTYAQWKNSTDLDMATRQFEAAFERAGKPHMEGRLKAAREYYNLYSGSTYTGAYTVGEPGVAVDAYGNPSNSAVSTGSDSSSNGFTSILGAISTAFSKIGDLFGFGSSVENTGTNLHDGGSYSRTGIYPSADLPTLSTNATQNFIDIANSQVGIKEGYENITEYGEFTGHNGQPWCASFVSWVMNKAYGGDAEKANKALLGSPTASTSVLYNRFKDNNMLTTTDPMPGDIILYKNDGSNFATKPAKHTGIVVSVNGDGTVNTVEGNTSSNGALEDNGGVVWTKTRTIGSSALLGFGRPNWGANSSASVANGVMQNRIGNVNMTAAGSGLGKSMSSLMKAKFNSGKVQSDINPKSIVRKSAGASGFSRSQKVESTTNMLTNLRNNISASSPKSGGSHSRSGAISAEVIEKLLASIIKVLDTISSNTSSVDKIYQVLSAYVQSGGSNAKALAAAKAAEASSNNTEIDSTIVDLVGTLAQLAKG